MRARQSLRVGAVLWAALFLVSVDLPAHTVELCKVTILPVDDIRVIAVAEFNANGVPLYVETRPMSDARLAWEQAQSQCQLMLRDYRRDFP